MLSQKINTTIPLTTIRTSPTKKNIHNIATKKAPTATSECSIMLCAL